jgi:AraC-like DNA-binding protein
MQREPAAATPMAFIRYMLLAYEKAGQDPAEALRAARITPREARQTDARITAAQMEAFSAMAMQQLDDEALGGFSRRLPWGSYGMLCRASITAPDLGVALKRWCRHHRLLTDDVRFTLDVQGDVACVGIDETPGPDARLRDFSLLTLLRNVHGFACWAIDSRIPVHEATFPHAPPRHHAAYALMFPGPVRFDAPRASLSFAAPYLALPLRRDERALRQMLQRALLLTVLQYRRDRLLVVRVRELLPRHGTADALARALHMSTRTLHRQLKEEGASLQALKDEVRRERASELLLRTAQPLKQIARAAGFRNEKSFGRAFRGWTGAAPGEWRRRGGR